MLTLGITGPTGCGKTTLLSSILGCGGQVVDCDALYSQLLREDTDMTQSLQEAFPAAFDETGSLQRSVLGRLVFTDPAAMERLNTIVFFHVNRAVSRLREKAKAENCPIFAIDAINLLESGLGTLCDKTIGVLAPVELRAERIMKRDGISAENAMLRIRAQKSDDFYRKHCDMILENTRDRASFAQTTEELCRRLLKGDSTMTKEEKQALLYQPKNGFDRLNDAQKEEMERYCKDYKTFLNASKTERECVVSAVAAAKAHGFVEYKFGMEHKPGDKFYYVNREKAIMLAVIGTEPLANGANITAAHTDSPRLDLKPNPLYEENELAYLKTHHYGGLRKYQWVTVPLELHGKVIRADGSQLFVKIGDQPDDPQFVINDLLPHLGREQGKKPLSEAIPSESLNILIGSFPEQDYDGKDRVKLSILRLLFEKYGIREEDFISAELQAVPAANARDIGLDRSMIGAYGHDDRVCAFAELSAILPLENPGRTAVCIFADKEEIGSEGVSGMQSEAFEHFVGDLCRAQGTCLRDCFANSFCISADVAAAYDPNFAEVYEKRNSAFLNYGVALCKYTGAGGKSSSSDASAEVVGTLRKLLNDNGVFWQMCELGKTDAGGGGTVAKYMANRNIDTIDAGVPVLSMHAPFEVVSKLDCYMTYKAMQTVFAKH